MSLIGFLSGIRNRRRGDGSGLMPNFLGRFRNRLLLVNLVSLTVVIVLSFTVIYLILSAHMHQTDNSRIGAIPSDVIRNAMLNEMESEGVGAGDADDETGFVDGTSVGDSGGDDDSESDGGKKRHNNGILYNLNGGVDLPIDYGKCFVINVDVFGGATVFSRIEGMTNDDFLTAIKTVVAHGDQNGRIDLDGAPWLFRLSKTQDGDSIVFLNVEDTDSALMRVFVSMIAVGVIVLALFFFVSRMFANRAMRPAAESFEKQRRFVADASHELKTPLAIIDANAEAALSVSGAQLDGQAAMFIGRIEEESGRMRGLIDSLLYLARTEDDGAHGDSSSEVLPTDLSKAAEDEIGRIETVLFERGVALEFVNRHEGALLVKADGERIRQAVLILLDNALKYTDRGGKVTAETGVVGRSGYVTVTNTGEGISAEDLPHIFDRFYRADKSRHSSGYGLGLSIADTIVQRSGGQIKAASEGGITSFTIELPLA
jgi:signal transduction histidine kinase